MNKDLLNSILAGLLVLAIGLFGGYSIGFYRARHSAFPEFKDVGEVNPGVATLAFKGTKNGELTGKVTGREARMIIGEKVFSLGEGQEFGLPKNELCAMAAVGPEFPLDAQFVASRRGKYYYSVLDERSWGLSPENRTFFKTEEEALRAGFEKAAPLSVK